MSFVCAGDGERPPWVVALDFRRPPGGDYQIRGVSSDVVGHERAAA